MEKLPQHIALIMDGNRRWAKGRGLTTRQGHEQGMVALEKIVKQAAKLGLKYLTVYALSTENMQSRKKEELEDLFNLMSKGFSDKIDLLQKENVKIVFLGDINNLPLLVRQVLNKTQSILGKNTGPQLNIAINYGGREEIIQAARRLTDKNISEEEFSSVLYTQGIPDPELIIRTGGQKRLSNFLLWQAAYSELYFTDKLWPDFDEKDFLSALEDYKTRKRNFGV